MRKQRVRVELTLETGETLHVPVPLYRERTLRTGEFIDLTSYQAFMRRRGTPHALDAAMRLLALCDRTEGDLRRRLRDAAYPAECIDAVINKLTDARLLDDAAVASRYVQSRKGRHGKGRLAAELRKRGVDADTAEAALEAVTEDSQMEAARLLCQKLLTRAQGEDATVLRRRALGYLARRGFSPALARRALEETLKAMQTDG